ncbi:hypothetical protein UlMin_015847 [Ulmus minor]
MATLKFSGVHFRAVFSILILKLVSSSSLPDQNSKPEKRVALFVFGDSLFDPGNNNYINTTTEYQANFWPYGESFFRVPTGRFSDGRLIPDFISEFAKLPLIPAYLKPGIKDYSYGVNFASGGAGALVESHQGFVIDLKTQLSYFKKVKKQLKHKLGGEKGKALLSSAVYLFSVGGNDYLAPFTSGNSIFYRSFTKDQYVGMVIGNLTTVLQEIYKKGGRKFAFVNIPPLGCLPGTKTLNKKEKRDACFEEATTLAKLHNRAIFKLLPKLQSQLKAFNYSKHDLYTSISERLNNPSKYGFKEAKMGCCGSGPNRANYSCGGMRGEKEFELCDNPKEYFFFDSVHPTQSAYKQLSELIWSGSSAITGPYNLKAFFQDIS